MPTRRTDEGALTRALIRRFPNLGEDEVRGAAISTRRIWESQESPCLFGTRFCTGAWAQSWYIGSGPGIDPPTLGGGVTPANMHCFRHRDGACCPATLHHGSSLPHMHAVRKNKAGPGLTAAPAACTTASAPPVTCLPLQRARCTLHARSMLSTAFQPYVGIFALSVTLQLYDMR